MTHFPRHLDELFRSHIWLLFRCYLRPITRVPLHEGYQQAKVSHRDVLFGRLSFQISLHLAHDEAVEIGKMTSRFVVFVEHAQVDTREIETHCLGSTNMRSSCGCRTGATSSLQQYSCDGRGIIGFALLMMFVRFGTLYGDTLLRVHHIQNRVQIAQEPRDSQ